MCSDTFNYRVVCSKPLNSVLAHKSVWAGQMGLELELTDKKAKILLGALRANRPTDVKSLTLRLKKRGVKIHINYVRRVVDELGKEKLIDVEILGRGFHRISPKDDIKTFKRLAHLFLASPHKFEFLSLPYTKNKLTKEFLNPIATQFWAKYGGAIKKVSDEIFVKIVSQTDFYAIFEPFREAMKTLPKEGITVNLLDIIRDSPFALWVLMFPEEAMKEIAKQIYPFVKDPQWIYDELLKPLQDLLYQVDLRARRS